MIRTGRLAASIACLACLCAATGGVAQQAGGAAAAPSFSQDLVPAPDLSLDPGNRRDRTLIFTALAGVKSEPAYFGADESKLGPDIRVNVAFLNFDAFRLGEELDVPDDPNARRQGFALGGSFRFVSGRDSGDFDDIDGLDDIDPSVELGLQVGYAWPQVEAFADLRYGVVGHESWVGELGANYVTRPNDRLALRVGPRLLYAGDSYADTYFGVDTDEAAESGLGAFEAEAGLMRTGVEVIATYQLSDRWWLEGRARYDRLRGDAADSPITRAGTDDQGTVSIGVRRAFVLDF